MEVINFKTLIENLGNFSKEEIEEYPKMIHKMEYYSLGKIWYIKRPKHKKFTPYIVKLNNGVTYFEIGLVSKKSKELVKNNPEKYKLFIFC